MKRGILSIIAGSIGLLAFGAVAGEFPDNWTWDEDAAARAEHAGLEGKPMQALDLSSWINGVVMSPDIKGKVVVLDFYATWCGPCMAAIPHNNELFEKYKGKGLVMIGICTSDRGQEQMAATVKKMGIKYPTARDLLLKTEKAWQVHYYPTYAIIDRKGIVRVIGLQPKYVEQVVKKLLEEGAPAAAPKK